MVIIIMGAPKSIMVPDMIIIMDSFTIICCVRLQSDKRQIWCNNTNYTCLHLKN